jgi:hypothetical protein
LAFVKAPPPALRSFQLLWTSVDGTESTDDQDSSDDDETKEQDQVRTIKNFLASHKERQAANERILLHGCVFKWLKSFERGERTGCVERNESS